jgi:hypothetical protein
VKTPYSTVLFDDRLAYGERRGGGPGFGSFPYARAASSGDRGWRGQDETSPAPGRSACRIDSLRDLNCEAAASLAAALRGVLSCNASYARRSKPLSATASQARRERCDAGC